MRIAALLLAASTTLLAQDTETISESDAAFATLKTAFKETLADE